MSLKKKKPRVILALTGISFYASSIDCFENNLITLGIISALVASTNMVAVFFVKRYPFGVKVGLAFINAVFAASASYLYFLAGKDKIQYGWAIVSFLYVIAVIVDIKKRLKQKNMSIDPAVADDVAKNK